MPSRDLEDAFSMSAFLAFLEFRSFQMEHPALSDTEIVATLSRVRTSSTGLDFRGGLSLHRTLDESMRWQQTEHHLRLFILEWINSIEPPWLRLVPYGREKLRVALADDQIQCFRDAGLLDDVPDDDALAWWDRLADLMRGTADSEKMQRARHAERLSLEFEVNRTRSLGISKTPKWVALEDNSLGYDILSYDIDPEGLVVTRLVEVKSRLSDAVFITRHEWDSASGAAQRSVLHVWDLPEERLHEYRVHEVAPHIPIDQGNGVWQDVRIALPA